MVSRKSEDRSPRRVIRISVTWSVKVMFVRDHVETAETLMLVSLKKTRNIRRRSERRFIITHVCYYYLLMCPENRSLLL